MAANCRFAFAVHALAVLAYHPGSDVSSELLARSVNTNPVVIRRLISDLRAAGLVVTQRGAGGGARLSAEPAAISLCDIYRAVEECRTFSAHPQEPNQGCPVGRKIQAVLSRVFSSAQTALEEELARYTLADVLENVSEEDASRAPGRIATPGPAPTR